MGLLRHSLFIDVDGKGRSTSMSAAAPMTSAPIRDPVGQAPTPPNANIGRKGKRGAALSYVPTSQEPVALPKRKSLSSILRHWRRDDNPPPVPTHPLVQRNSTARGPQPTTPLSPTSSVFSTQTAPVQRFPGPGVCSTLPSPSPQSQYAPSMPSSPNGGGRRVYRGPPPGSTSSLRGPINISPPIPGVGDVPAHYRFRGDGNAPPLPEMPNPRIMAARAHNRLMNRQSSPALRTPPDMRRPQGFIPTTSQTTLATISGSPPRESIPLEEARDSPPNASGATSPPPGASAPSLLGTPPRGPPPPRPGRVVGLGLGNVGLEQTFDRNNRTSPRAPPRPPPLQHPKPQPASRHSSIQGRGDGNMKGKRDTEYIDDDEVAALLTAAHIPPSSPVASVRSKISVTTTTAAREESVKERPRSVSHTPSASISSIPSAPPTAWPTSPIGGRTTPNSPGPRPPSVLSMAEHVNKPVTSTPNRERSGSGTGPSSILSNVSWASVGSGRGKRGTIIASHDTDNHKQQEKNTVEALVDSPVAMTPLSPLGAVSAAASISNHNNIPSSPSTQSIENCSELSHIDPTPPRTRPLSLRPRSRYSTSAFSELSSPDSSYSSLAQTLQEAEEQDTGRTPTSKEFYIQQARERREAMQLTTAHLEAEAAARHQRSQGHYTSLSPRNSYMSISGVSTGAVGNGTLNNRSFYRSSQLTVRDERRDSHGSAISRLTSASGYADLSVPALLAEIDMLRRNGERLQAELFAVKSQVSLLLPPTPTERAETLEALNDLDLHTNSSATPSPARKRISRNQRLSSYGSYMPPSPSVGHGNGNGNDGERSDSAASTPSSSASETWPITPVMNGGEIWQPGPDSIHPPLISYKGSHATGAAGNVAPVHDARHYPSTGMVSMSRIPRPVSAVRMSGTPPPRPPRAARRATAAPPLPPGAAAAVAGAARSRASSIMTATGAE